MKALDEGRLVLNKWGVGANLIYTLSIHRFLSCRLGTLLKPMKILIISI